MNESYTKHINAALSLFKNQFSKAYKQLDVKKRARLLPYVSTIFRRWYYSALIEDTALTPANMIESVNLAHNRHADAFPVVKLRSLHKYAGMETAMLECTPAAHPIVADLRQLVAYCSPSIDLSNEDGFWDHQAIELSGRLSLQDPHYAAYLLELGLWMNLITKIPSIYANRAQISKGCDTTLSLSDEEIFQEVADTAVKMASASLGQLIALPEPVFTEAFIRDILKKPMETDDIFQCVYDTIGFSLDDLADADIDGSLDGVDAAFLSGTFMMGIVLDKYFFTPFSYYLRFIRLDYVLPFDFSQELTYFLETYDTESDLSASFFAPCSKYTFTALGLSFFDVKPDIHNHIDVSRMLPFTLLEERVLGNQAVMDALPVWVNQPGYQLSRDFNGGQAVYTMRVKAESDPGLWLQLDVPEDFSLHRLYLELIIRFGLLRNDDYSFFHDEVESPFTEYASALRAKRNKKSSETVLNTLDFSYKRNMILSAYNQTIAFGNLAQNSSRGVKLLIEVMENKPRESGKAYPVLTRISKGLRAMYEL